MKKDNQPGLISPQSKPQPQPGPSYSASPSNECRLKIRLPNSQVLSHTFSANEQLAAVRLYVQTNRSDMNNCPLDGFQSFTFMFPPNTIYTNDDMDKTLLELGLCPSARLIVSDLKR
jgi:PREDICTED: UBX domain-containing protein 1-like, partial